MERVPRLSRLATHFYPSRHRDCATTRGSGPEISFVRALAAVPLLNKRCIRRFDAALGQTRFSDGHSTPAMAHAVASRASRASVRGAYVAVRTDVTVAVRTDVTAFTDFTVFSIAPSGSWPVSR